MPTRKKSSKPRAAVTDGLTPLPPRALRWHCDHAALSFDSTADVDPAAGIVGQEAAVDALRFGVEATAPGQHIFIRGLSGTGRLTLALRLLRDIQPVCTQTQDRCYVHSFTQHDRPALITLPAGEGRKFRRRVEKLADFIRDDLKAALSSEGITARKAALERATSAKLKEVVAPFERSLEEAGLTLVSVQADPVVQTAIFPLVDGKAVPPEEFDQRHARGEITDAVHKAARESFTRIEHRLTEVNDRAGEIRRQHEEAVAELLGTAVRSILGARVRDILRTFPRPAVETFVTGIVNDVVTNWLGSIGQETDFTSLYRVNVVLEHHGEGACPVIAEDAPTVRNLIGTIDYDFESGDEPRTSHMGIRAGSLLRADGGFLLLEARDVLNEEAAWKVLMRVLRTGRLEIAPPETVLRGAVPSLKPEPIEINMTVVMIGDPDTYFALDAQDPDFPQLFKVLADFDTTMPRDDTGAAQYAGVLARIAREEGLGPFDRGAVAALVEHGARIASRNGKLTARFGRIADVAREGAFIARRRRARAVGAADVDEAVRRAKRRANLPSRRFRELVADGTIRVETVGSVVGQINGLAVLQAGPMVYGFPTRITATIGPGTAGVINIDREAALSGAIHTKGFYILGGLLRYLLRTDHPLAFDASVAFEQSYGAIDGDSASGAEICCLLSALTDVPLRQDIAVTGAIDQLGHILAVGAVNEKVEGFFDACRDVGLTGTQGVMIPKANAGDLMLRKDLVDACREGMFSVYAVETVHEVLSCLTGRPAGHRSHNGAYPKGTLLARAVARAREYWLKAAEPSASAARKTRARQPRAARAAREATRR